MEWIVDGLVIVRRGMDLLLTTRRRVRGSQRPGSIWQKLILNTNTNTNTNTNSNSNTNTNTIMI